mmetsp:Transcript_22244/g.61722  ORF Transcript_22244/g.61722 Transcript_22244/m.61722 type:complete len:246 (-) Transcript_22244:361-1098(-)
MQSQGKAVVAPAAGAPPEQNGSAGDDPLKQLLMSASRECMNLSLLRTKAEDLRQSLEQIIQALQFAPNSVEWGATIDQFNLLSVQYYNLIGQLRPTLKHYVVHPKVVNEQNHEVLPLMMSTRVLPEMEKEEAVLMKNHHARHGNTSAEIQYITLQGEIEAFNSLIDHLTIPKQSVRDSGLLDSKSALCAEILAPLAKSSAAAMSKLRADAAGGQPFTAQRQQMGGRLQGPDLLLAAATRGEGLRG